MWIGLVLIFLFEYFFQKNRSIKNYLIATLYFLIALILSRFSLHNFSLSGDELLYDSCGRGLYGLIKAGRFFDFPTSVCDVAASHYFSKSMGFIFFLAGGDNLGFISLNIACVYIASALMSLNFLIHKDLQKKIFYFVLFSPPTLYLILRPAKEASIALVISLAFYVMTFSSFKKKMISILIVLFFAYLIRWQLALGIGVALGVYGFWMILVRFEMLRLRNLALVILVLGGATFIFKAQIVNFLNINYIRSQNVHEFAILPDSPQIYKYMNNNESDNSLEAWNVFIAHVGGLVTPFPLRFLKEYLKTNRWQFNIIEEFVYISFWIFISLPLALYSLKRIFWKPLKEIFHTDIFKISLVIALFSMASFSILTHAPQMFRYKIPLNLYFMSLVGVEIFVYDVKRLFADKLFRFILVTYFLGLIFYCYIGLR